MTRFPKLPAYEIPKEDSDLWKAGRVFESKPCDHCGDDALARKHNKTKCKEAVRDKANKIYWASEKGQARLKEEKMRHEKQTRFEAAAREKPKNPHVRKYEDYGWNHGWKISTEFWVLIVTPSFNECCWYFSVRGKQQINHHIFDTQENSSPFPTADEALAAGQAWILKQEGARWKPCPGS